MIFTVSSIINSYKLVLKKTSDYPTTVAFNYLQNNALSKFNTSKVSIAILVSKLCIFGGISKDVLMKSIADSAIDMLSIKYAIDAIKKGSDRNELSLRTRILLKKKHLFKGEKSPETSSKAIVDINYPDVELNSSGYPNNWDDLTDEASDYFYDRLSADYIEKRSVLKSKDSSSTFPSKSDLQSTEDMPEIVKFSLNTDQYTLQYRDNRLLVYYDKYSVNNLTNTGLPFIYIDLIEKRMKKTKLYTTDYNSLFLTS